MGEAQEFHKKLMGSMDKYHKDLGEFAKEGKDKANTKGAKATDNEAMQQVKAKKNELAKKMKVKPVRGERRTDPQY